MEFKRLRWLWGGLKDFYCNPNIGYYLAGQVPPQSHADDPSHHNETPATGAESSEKELWETEIDHNAMDAELRAMLEADGGDHAWERFCRPFRAIGSLASRWFLEQPQPPLLRSGERPPDDGPSSRPPEPPMPVG